MSRNAASLLLAPASPKYLLLLLTLYGIEWMALAIDPFNREDWLLENLLPAIALPLLVWLQRRRDMSVLAWTLVYLFMALHTIGSHYTYAEVPYDEWFRAATGHSLDALLGFERNMFDRVVHFLYGFLLYPFCRELLGPAVDARRPGLCHLLVGGFLMSHAGIYEAIEWIAAELVGGDLGVAYLGTQGDVWDAQKDMALAFVGTLLAIGLVHVLSRRRQAAIG